MKKNNKMLLALLIAGLTTSIAPSNSVYAKDLSEENKISEVQNLSNDNVENFTLVNKNYYTNTTTNDSYFNFEDDEVNFEKNEANSRNSDGTNKFNRATETDRETFGEDKNVTNIDPEVASKLKETNGEYGKKNGKYSNNNLKAILDPIKDIVVNPGKNENEIAITWFAKGEVTDSKLVFDGKEYKPIRARKTGDSNGYSTYTALVNVKPGNTYTYYVQTGEYKSKTYTLKTKAFGKDNEFSIAYFGDPQMGSGDKVWDKMGLNKNTQAKVDQDKIDFAKTLKKASELDPHFYISMGDNVEISSFEGEYDYFLDNDLYKERIFSTITGNHETYVDKDDTSQQNTVFADHFYLPNESKLGSISKINDDKTPFYISGDYYYSYGDTLFLNLNSNVEDSNEHSAFIKEAIAKATKEHGKNFSWKVVSFHHAPYSTATHTSDSDILQRRHELVRIFNQNGIDIVLNGHDHIYTRTGQMIAGEQALSFKEAYGTDPTDKNAEIKDGFSKTYNNKVYDNGKVIVDGIKLDYDKKEVTNPRGTLFLTMSASAGAKFYNPIGEDQWFVVKSLDDRSQLFSNLSFSKNRFNLTTMDQFGKVVDTYTINKTDDIIKNQKVNSEKLDQAINEALAKNPIDNKDNMILYKEAIAKAKEVSNLDYKSDEEVNAAIEVLNTRLSSVKFLAENKPSDSKKLAKKTKAAKSFTSPKKDSKNPKTGIGSLTGVYALLTLAGASLFKSKRK